MLSKCLRKTLSGFDSILYIGDNELKFPFIALFGYRFEGILKAYPRPNHNGELVSKVQDILSARPALDFEISYPFPDTCPGAAGRLTTPGFYTLPLPLAALGALLSFRNCGCTNVIL
jgi:hypothetical protein